MYLDEFQKELVRSLVKNGSNAISYEFSQLLDIENSNFTFSNYIYGSILHPKSMNSLIYYFKSKNQKDKFIDSLEPIPESSINKRTSMPLNQTEKDEFENQRKIDKELIEFFKKEKQDQWKKLNSLQEKIEMALHLVRILSKNNLVISYEKHLQKGILLGCIINEKDYTVNNITITEMTNETSNRLYISLINFFRTGIIVLPGLSDFISNNFCTNEEMSRRHETHQLKWQTIGVLVGVGITAIMTLIAAFIAHPNTKDIKMITDSINQLSTKVEKLDNTQKQEESNVTEPWFVLPDDSIKTFSIPKDIN